MVYKIRTKDGYEVERDQMEVAVNGVVIDESLYPPEMIESMVLVEEEDCKS